MSDSTAFYAAQAKQCLDFPQLSGLKKLALDDFERLGFPTRQDEAWKYSPADMFNKMAFQVEQDYPSLAYEAGDFPMDCIAVSMQGALLTQDCLPEGVIVQPWSEALVAHAEKIAPYLGHILKHQHGFQALNTAMLQSGLFIYVPKNTRLEKPLLLINTQQTSQSARYIRHLIVMEEKSELCVIEDYQTSTDAVYLTNTITEATLHPYASLKHYKLQRESLNAYHVGDLAVVQDQHSRFESHSISLGGKWVRSDIHVAFSAAHASCLMNGIYMTADAQHVDHHTVVEHRIGHCTSEQNYKGMISGHSRAVFNGAVLVAENAQQTVAKQHNKNLLLSKQAEIDTKPELQIFADDVVCTHGATVGQLDEEALFYLAARGISEDDARYFLVHAFVEENLKLLASDALSMWLSQLISQHLGW